MNFRHVNGRKEKEPYSLLSKEPWVAAKKFQASTPVPPTPVQVWCLILYIPQTHILDIEIWQFNIWINYLYLELLILLLNSLLDMERI